MQNDYILVVDDNAGLRHLLFELFAEEGYLVEVAECGKDAIKKAWLKIPLLILLDLRMPGLSGMDTFDAIKRFAPGVPVIIITAYGEKAIINEVIKNGVHCCINKPFDINELRKVVKKVLTNNNCQKDVS